MARQSKEMKALKERMRYWRKRGLSESTYYQSVERKLESGEPFDAKNALRIKEIGAKNVLLNALLERNKVYIYRDTGNGLFNELKNEKIFEPKNIDYYIEKLQEYEKNNAQIIQDYEQSPNF